MPDEAETIKSSFPEEVAAYKRSLQAAEQQMQSEYDKGVMTLSGGALGISLAFLKDIVGKDHIVHGDWFIVSWTLWATSIACVLASFFTSTQSLRNASDAVDNLTIYLDYGKCKWTKTTKYLNLLSGSLFILGVIAIIIFISCNLHQ